MKNRLDLLEVGMLDLAGKIYELEKNAGKQAEQNRAVRKTLSSLKQLLNSKGIISDDEFEETLELYEVSQIASELPDFHEEEQDEYQEEICH